MKDTTLRLNGLAKERTWSLTKMEWWVEEWNITMPLEEIIEDRSLEQKNGEENDNSSHKWTWKHPCKEGLNRVVVKNNNEKNMLIVGLWKHLKTWGEILPLKKTRLDWYEQGDKKIISPGG